ncbi:hypothetical protein C4N20_13725 [Fusobacterium ulcerans]|jgi:hypothetical protein|uniref:Uncharacterized protein n=2 Tax=Fusobacterium ulcerans TaxID=861 RepID=A0AAX1TUV0_9FUSO|nr:hypothetical protein [Fusobacterium ulcerans]AVQ29100.1 hypothetical protein C4N20_13725 [Fusobacterium ulcerans]EFS26568.1 hypothetical protein FUAG_02083 [Fusobacterium ulcerans ATCC 49185]RGY67077.1 hypothetical protein DXA30_00475 [Fusobacterium ulcerans]SQJ02367.1 Uncharacterised protein [Fusobacterium ulcerans]
MENQYNFLWYPLTSFIEKNNENINFEISEIISPYIEVNMTNINNIQNEIETSDVKVEINPFIRFNDIFQIITYPDFEEMEIELKKSLVNILFHLLGEMDLYLGQNKKDIIVKEIRKDIEKGCFGKDSTKLFKLFKEYEKHIVVDILYDMYCHLNMIEAFKKSIKKIFKDSIIYDNLSSDTNLVIYLNYIKTDENIKKVEFLKEIFLPIGLELDLFWEYHFGVIGVEITMKIGEIAVF